MDNQQFVMLILLAVFIFAILVMFNFVKLPKTGSTGGTGSLASALNNASSLECGPDNTNYIQPKQFKTGFIDNSQQQSINICAENNLAQKPITTPYVNYGLKPISSDAACIEHIRAP